MFTKPLENLSAELSSIVKNYIPTGLMRVHGDWMMLVRVCCMLVITFSCFFIAVSVADGGCIPFLLILHVEQGCLLGFFALIVVVTARGGFCCQTHIFASGHIFFYEGDNINETFQSVDLEVIVSQFNELKNHVLYWYMSFNDPVLYW